MKYLKLFENFGNTFQHIEFCDIDNDIQFKPISPNESDYVLYAELFKSLPGPWCSTRNEIMDAFDLQDGYSENYRNEIYDIATNGIDEYYLDLYKLSETGDEMVDKNDAWYVMEIFPQENESIGFKIKCDGEVGLKEFIQFAKSWNPNVSNRHNHEAFDEFFEVLKSYVP
jgi:hypothetical protein